MRCRRSAANLSPGRSRDFAQRSGPGLYVPRVSEVAPPNAQCPIFAAGFWLVTALAVVSCSLVLNDDGKQCQEERDCARFPNAVCNKNAGICIARPFFPDAAAGMAGFAGVGGPAGSGGNGGAAVAPPVDGGPLVLDGGRPTGTGGQVGGGGGAAGGSVRECPDLDDNGVADCRESLVTNPDFKQGIDGWTPESDMRQYFQVKDGDGNAASGALAVVNASRSDSAPGFTIGGSRQCVTAPGPNTYEMYLQALIGPTAGGMSSAGATLQFYSAANCAGQPSGAFMPSWIDASTTGWRVMHGVVATPAGTRSILVRLVVVKPMNQAPTEAWFDNMLLKTRR